MEAWRSIVSYSKPNSALKSWFCFFLRTKNRWNQLGHEMYLYVYWFRETFSENQCFILPRSTRLQIVTVVFFRTLIFVDFPGDDNLGSFGLTQWRLLWMGRGVGGLVSSWLCWILKSLSVQKTNSPGAHGYPAGTSATKSQAGQSARPSSCKFLSADLDVGWSYLYTLWFPLVIYIAAEHGPQYWIIKLSKSSN